MRTTISIDDDVLHAVQERARRERRPAGAVLSDLVRQALTQGPTESESPLDESFYGFQPFPARGPLVTNDLIDQLRDDESV